MKFITKNKSLILTTLLITTLSLNLTACVPLALIRLL